MKKIVLATIALALVAGAALAQPPPPPQGDRPMPGGPEMKRGPGEHRGPGFHRTLNNIVKVSGAEKTALCVCGKEFKVTDKSPAFEHRGTTIYTCSEGCRDKLARAAPEEMRAIMGPLHEQLRAMKLATNAVQKGDRQIATCTCGKTFDVTDQSPTLTGDGVRFFCCSPDCEEQLLKLPAAERAAAEAKVVGKS